MALRLHHDLRHRGADHAYARRRALPGRPRATHGAQPGCRRRFLQQGARPVNHGATRSLVTVRFSAREALARFALLRMASALASPWRFLKDVVTGLWAMVAGTRSHDERQLSIT